ncbi:carbohydrate kinase family protein [Poritiphilus flavus]|uniref:Carbohydrate kinase family protein n=1 Tax=Poritiphilus flavus TaxID=2697053 RepID=A0A6L9EFD2_9FLAO|nr:carbohydrate kinase family protein [Poritiphilus flavus]NAS12989.1 carbohydrate kinase family protein [Poritiphilus flavus]
MANYKVAVLGPIPRDHITTHHGEVIEKYGCATHTAIGLARLLGDEGTVYPVSHVRKIDEGPIKAILDAYPNIDTTHITSDSDQGDVIQLKFVDQNNRLEKQTGFMNPIVPEDLKELLHCDVFVCVPITDYEVSLDTLKYIKQNSKGIIIFDAHGPTNTATISGDRLIKFWIDRDQWLPYIDVLKMNLEESRCCWFEKEYQLEDLKHFEDESTEHLPALADHVLNHGIKCLIVTLDEKGGAVFYKKDGHVHQEIVQSIWVDHVVDTTGCGDSFAGGLGFGLLADPTDYIRAAKYANALGAQRTQGRTFEVFKSREETDQMIQDTYGAV